MKIRRGIKAWLPHSFETVRTENNPIEDKTGEYQTPILSIVKKDQPNDMVVDLLPEGISFLTDDALIEIQGTDDEAEMIYMQENNRRYTFRNGEKCPMYEGFFNARGARGAKISFVDQPL